MFQLVIACIWITGTSIDGDDRRLGGEQAYPDSVIRALTDHVEHRHRAAAQIGSTPPDEAPWEQRSDHAAFLLYQGRTGEAITILERVELQSPGHYAVASNLGTAYELAGNNAEALRWIREGIKRDPTSHEGTEWLHVKILEAKIAATTSVLDLDFGDHDYPEMPTEWPEGQTFRSTREALAYQLHERLGFIGQPEPMTAQLLADYATLTAFAFTLEHAVPVFDLALSYKPADEAAVRKRRDALVEVIEARHFWNQVTFWGIVAGVVALIGILVYLIIWRRRRRRMRGDIAPARVVRA